MSTELYLVLSTQKPCQAKQAKGEEQGPWISTEQRYSQMYLFFPKNAPWWNTDLGLRVALFFFSIKILHLFLRWQVFDPATEADACRAELHIVVPSKKSKPIIPPGTRCLGNIPPAQHVQWAGGRSWGSSFQKPDKWIMSGGPVTNPLKSF